MFSRACEYAIRAVLYISIKSINGSRLGIEEIAREIDAPAPFTAKILQPLSREGIIASIKGPNGGFYVDPKAKPVLLNRIVQVIDGEDVLNECTLGLKECSDKYPCPIHHDLKAYKDKLRKVLKEKTIQQLAKELAEGKSFLKTTKVKQVRIRTH
jgi:Rrf2 family protein